MTFREEKEGKVNEVGNINPVFMQIYLEIKAKFHAYAKYIKYMFSIL